MSITETEEQNDLQPIDNVVNLRLVTGGRGSNPNWLLSMPDYTMFLARPKTHEGFMLEIFKKVSRVGTSFAVVIESRHELVHVDSIRFSEQMELLAETWPVKED